MNSALLNLPDELLAPIIDNFDRESLAAIAFVNSECRRLARCAPNFEALVLSSSQSHEQRIHQVAIDIGPVSFPQLHKLSLQSIIIPTETISSLSQAPL
jgi:hypothetical protein